MAPTIKKEAQRLKVLWQYDVLDTVPEEVFDDLTELAARICEAPVALISLIDEDRQWFKAKVGVTLSETSRDISFCAHAIKQTDLFIIPDATQDARFANNPLVISDPKIRFLRRRATDHAGRLRARDVVRDRPSPASIAARTTTGPARTVAPRDDAARTAASRKRTRRGAPSQGRDERRVGTAPG